MSIEKNKATLIELFKNLGPGEERWINAYKKAFVPEVTWWISGTPALLNLEEAIAQVKMLAGMNVSANPIIDFRRIDAYDNGKTIYFERHGCLVDSDDKILTDWDIMGVFNFNDEGRIVSIRDYMDNFDLYKFFSQYAPPELIEEYWVTSHDNHPLNSDKKQADDPFYWRNKLQEAASA